MAVPYLESDHFSGGGSLVERYLVHLRTHWIATHGVGGVNRKLLKRISTGIFIGKTVRVI